MMTERLKKLALFWLLVMVSPSLIQGSGMYVLKDKLNLYLNSSSLNFKIFGNNPMMELVIDLYQEKKWLEKMMCTLSSESLGEWQTVEVKKGKRKTSFLGEGNCSRLEVPETVTKVKLSRGKKGQLLVWLENTSSVSGSRVHILEKTPMLRLSPSGISFTIIGDNPETKLVMEFYHKKKMIDQERCSLDPKTLMEWQTVEVKRMGPESTSRERKGVGICSSIKVPNTVTEIALSKKKRGQIWVKVQNASKVSDFNTPSTIIASSTTSNSYSTKLAVSTTPPASTKSIHTASTNSTLFTFTSSTTALSTLNTTIKPDITNSTTTIFHTINSTTILQTTNSTNNNSITTAATNTTTTTISTSPPALSVKSKVPFTSTLKGHHAVFIFLALLLVCVVCVIGVVFWLSLRKKRQQREQETTAPEWDNASPSYFPFA